MKNKLFPIIATLVWVSTASLCPADTIVTSDGSRVVGEVLGLNDGKLTVATGFAGEILIDISEVVSISTDKPVNIEFDSGDKLFGKVSHGSGEDKPVMKTALGDVAVNPASMTAIWREGEQSPETVAARAEMERVKEELTPKWSLTLEAGGKATEGNTDTLEGRGKFELRRKTQDDLLKFYASADYSEQNDRRNRNEYKGGVFYERMLTERWNWYTRFEMEHDEFEILDLRSTVAAGAGYYWIKKSDHELATRAGVGYRHESYDNGETSDDGVLDFGLDYRLDIYTWAQFTHATTYSPSFDDFDDYRLTLDTAFAFPLANSDVWKLKLGMLNEYNSRPQPGLDRLDNTYYANVVLEIK